jgi:hypothetical protein
MPKITQEIIDFWEDQHFVFEVRTNFNYIQYLKILIELERIKIKQASLNAQSQHHDA